MADERQVPDGATAAEVVGDDVATFKAWAVDRIGTLLYRTSGLGGGDTAWRVIGAAGQPAFTNGWGNLGGGFATAAFRKLSSGLVIVKGEIAGGTVNTAAFTLPAGYRPAAGGRQTFAVDSNSAYGRTDVDGSGNVIVSVFGGNVAVGINFVFYGDQ